MSDIDIVDKLRDKFYELRQIQQSGVGYAYVEGIPEMLYEASMEIHRLQALAYSYPPNRPYLPEGITWRQEYEVFHEQMTKMTAESFADWQHVMKEDNTHGTE